MKFIKKLLIAGFDYVGPKMSKAKYKAYTDGVKLLEKKINKTSTVPVTIVPTKNRVANFYGANNDLLQSAQSSEYIDAVYSALAKKGIKTPKRSLIMEELIPSWSGIGAMYTKGILVYNPRTINRLKAREIFHEIGHSLHQKLEKGCGFITNLIVKFDRKFGKFLSKAEKEIYINDIKRAYAEGHYEGMPFKHWIDDKLFAFGKLKNKDIKKVRKHPEGFANYGLLDRYEFVAEVFSLRLQGFKFSPEIIKKYEKFGGPEIKETFSKDELDNLLKLQKRIRKKTLSDYGLSLTDV